ncbi:MAG: resolvase [Podoviridae sp. ctcf755]|nr:MAG: resolvase [Podoviridae sp. ctcf755]
MQSELEERKKAFVYVRVSTYEQYVKGYSISNQKRELLQYCESMNWEVIKIFIEKGVTAKNLDLRKEANAAIEEAKKGECDYIVSLKIDRIFRNTEDLLATTRILLGYDVILKFKEQETNYLDPYGKASMTIMGMVSELELSVIKDRTMSGKIEKARQGIKSPGRVIPYGFDYVDKQFVANEKANIVRMIFDDAAKGYGFTTIAYHLRSKNVPSINDLSWNNVQIKRIITNKIYIGHCCFKIKNKEIVDVLAKNIEPIVSEEIWYAANNLYLAKTQNGKITKYAYDDFIFADVLYCSCCGWKFSSKKSKRVDPKKRPAKYEDRFYRYYKCIHNDTVFENVCSNKKVLNAKKFENYFLQQLNNFIIQPKNEKTVNEKINRLNDIKLLEKSIIELNTKKKRLLDKYLSGIIEDDMYISKNSDIVQEIDYNAKKIEELKSFDDEKEFDLEYLSKLKFVINDIWDVMDNKEKRNFISSTFEKITIDNGEIIKIIFR